MPSILRIDQKLKIDINQQAAFHFLNRNWNAAC